MEGFIAILGDWHFWALAVGYYAVISFISGMPEPCPGGSRGYLWAYNSLHAFAGNITRVVSAKFNGGNGANQSGPKGPTLDSEKPKE